MTGQYTIIETRCPYCYTKQNIRVATVDYKDWKSHKMIQDAFPYLNADEREALITGICKRCWGDSFPPERDEEPEEYNDVFEDDMPGGFH